MAREGRGSRNGEGGATEKHPEELPTPPQLGLPEKEAEPKSEGIRDLQKFLLVETMTNNQKQKGNVE